MKQYSKNINLSILNNPNYFSEQAVPFEYRDIYVNDISKLLTFPISAHHAINFRSKIQYLIKKYSESTFNELLHEKLRAEITEQDRHRTLKLRDVDSFLHGWIHG
jgi:hypothetical protein